MTAEKTPIDAVKPIASIIIVMVLFLGMFLAVNVWYVSYSVNTSSHRFCELVDVLYRAHQISSPSPTEYEKQVSKAIADLHKSLKC